MLHNRFNGRRGQARRMGRKEFDVHAVTLEPLTPSAFAPFGEALVPPTSAGRSYFNDALGSLREAAPPTLSLATVETITMFPLTVTAMERHEFSSQSFIPLGPVSFLVIVAPHAAGGGPDTGRARIFDG